MSKHTYHNNDWSDKNSHTQVYYYIVHRGGTNKIISASKHFDRDGTVNGKRYKSKEAAQADFDKL